jgi:hypothetical protein
LHCCPGCFGITFVDGKASFANESAGRTTVHAVVKAAFLVLPIAFHL